MICCATFQSEKSLGKTIKAALEMAAKLDGLHGKCPICGKSVLKKCLKRHILTHSDSVSRCKRCAIHFSSEEKLKHHCAIKHGLSFVCNYCGCRYQTKSAMKEHMLAKHTSQPLAHTCQECGKGFLRVQQLKDHMNIHKNIRPYVCLQCEKRFMSQYTLSRHMKCCGKDIVATCELCGKKFKGQQNLTEHTAAEHRDLMYDCECGAFFKRRCQRFQHRKVCHKWVKVTPGTGSEVMKASDAPFSLIKPLPRQLRRQLPVPKSTIQDHHTTTSAANMLISSPANDLITACISTSQYSIPLTGSSSIDESALYDSQYTGSTPNHSHITSPYHDNALRRNTGTEENSLLDEFDTANNQPYQLESESNVTSVQRFQYAPVSNVQQLTPLNTQNIYFQAEDSGTPSQGQHIENAQTNKTSFNVEASVPVFQVPNQNCTSLSDRAVSVSSTIRDVANRTSAFHAYTNATNTTITNNPVVECQGQIVHSYTNPSFSTVTNSKTELFATRLAEEGHRQAIHLYGNPSNSSMASSNQMCARTASVAEGNGQALHSCTNSPNSAITNNTVIGAGTMAGEGQGQAVEGHIHVVETQEESSDIDMFFDQ